MKKILGIFIRIVFHLCVIFLLTVFTQVGGMVYLLTLLLAKYLDLSPLKFSGLFLGAYLLFSVLILPLSAPIFGREALPISGTVRPLNLATCLFNRHYVSPLLKQEIQALADQMAQKFPGTTTQYLDANFPFIDGFPLIPHLSHNDGRKLDLAFYYTEVKTGNAVNTAPSWIGYGIYDGPKTNEVNYPKKCAVQGKWQYGAVTYLAPKWHEKDFEVDAKRTRTLVQLLAQHPHTQKIFIEPHLKTRWGLNQFDNIRFTGCHAVRHDDHIHVQIR